VTISDSLLTLRTWSLDIYMHPPMPYYQLGQLQLYKRMDSSITLVQIPMGPIGAHRAPVHHRRDNGCNKVVHSVNFLVRHSSMWKVSYPRGRSYQRQLSATAHCATHVRLDLESRDIHVCEANAANTEVASFHRFDTVVGVTIVAPPTTLCGLLSHHRTEIR